MVEALERRDLPSAATLLHISSNGRFLVDANNQPFYLVGDAAWTLPAGITTGSASNPNTANYYFQTRANEGYNAVLMDADVLLGASPVGAPSRGPLDANGNPPFDAYLPGTSTYDVSTPDTAYWNNVYNIVSTAGQYGIQVLLDVYDNYNPWFTGGNSSNSTAKLNAYGQFLGQKFAGLDNIIWMVGNDYSENSAGDADLTAVIQGIRQYDTRHLGWAMDEYGATFDNTGLRQYLQLNTIYEYSTGPWRSLYLGQYNRSDFGPIFNIESGYENNTSLGVSEANLRDEHYSFLLAGATGDTYGNEFVWPFDDAWQNALTSEGAHEMTYLANFVNSMPWYNLVPDQSGTVFQGVGSPTDYSGAYTTDGTLAIAYKPSTGTGSQSFTVNMGTFAGSVTAQWYDPTNGTYTTIGTFANSGTHTFNSPSGNSTGVDNDFVLVLRASATHLVVTAQPPGSITVSSGFGLVVAAEDGSGKVDPTFNGSVTVALASNPGGATLGGTLTVTAVNGVAAFSGLTLDKAGNGYTLLVSASGLTSASTNSLNVTAPQPPLSPPPMIQSATVVFTQKRNRKGKPVGKPTLTGFQFTFNTAMNPATTGNQANYTLGTYVQVIKRVGRRNVLVRQLKPVGFTVSYSSSHSVKLLLTGKQTFPLGGQITLIATGISSAAGGFLDGNGDGTGGDNAVYNVSANGRGISHA
jgi:uncharacterized protein DUF4038/collagenase-like protein with putative collagen-binding domain